MLVEQTYFIPPWWSSGQGSWFIVHSMANAKIPSLNPAWDIYMVQYVYTTVNIDY